METSNQLYQILAGTAPQLPSLLIMLGGIVWAIFRWKRHPKVSLTVIIGLTLMLLHGVIFVVVFTAIHRFVGYDIGNFQTFQMIASILYNLTLAVFTAILIVAIFMHRKKLPETPVPEYVAAAHAA
jgi:hypothetical protein